MSDAPRHTPLRARVPLVGGTLDYVRDPLDFMQRVHDAHGPVSDHTMLGATWTLLIGPDAVGAALVNRDKAFANGPGWAHLVGPFFDRGLMLLDFEEHHAHRRLMQEAFTRDRLASYADQLAPAVAAGVAGWQPDEHFRAYPALKALTLDLATEVFLGGAELSDPAELDRVNAAFIDCVQAASALVRLPVPGTRWGRALRGRRLLEDFIGRQLPARRAGEGDDLASVLCRVSVDGERFSDTDVVNHLIFVLMAAHDTSTTTVSTMLRFLGQHPGWRERARAEALAAPEVPGLDDLEQMTDLDLVMKECLRLVTPVPALARRTVRATEVLGHRIPAGRLVSVMPHHMHHDPAWWTDPERFDPERFAPDRREDKAHRFAWAPFGGGVHKCLGMYFAGLEVKLVMHAVLRRFDWEVPSDYETPMNNHSLPVPRDGQPIRLRTRRVGIEEGTTG
jgi:cytochrome P450